MLIAGRYIDVLTLIRRTFPIVGSILSVFFVQPFLEWAGFSSGPALIITLAFWFLFLSAFQYWWNTVVAFDPFNNPIYRVQYQMGEVGDALFNEVLFTNPSREEQVLQRLEAQAYMRRRQRPKKEILSPSHRVAEDVHCPPEMKAP